MKVWGVQVSANIYLVERDDNSMTRLKTRDLLADGYDCAGDAVFSISRGILFSGKGEMTILEQCKLAAQEDDVAG